MYPNNPNDRNFFDETLPDHNAYPQNAYPNYPQYPQQPPQPKHSKWWYWFSMSREAQQARRQWIYKSKGRTALVGCGIPIAAILLCSLCISVSNASTNASHATTASNGQTTQSVTHASTGRTAIAKVPTPTAAPTQPPTPTPTPTPIPPQPTPTPVPVVQQTQPTPTPAAPPACGGILDNGVCYSTDPTGGQIASSVPGDFCSFVKCVSDWNTKQNGYVVLCGNGVYSHSGGVTGACSRDGGVAGTLYSH